MFKFPGKRYPIFIEADSSPAAEREIRELDDIEPIGIGKDEKREVGLEVLTTKPDHMGRTMSVKISVVADEDHAWTWADTPPKMKKIIKKLFDRCTPEQQQAFECRYGEIHRIPRSKLCAAYVACEDYLLRNGKEKNGKK